MSPAIKAMLSSLAAWALAVGVAAPAFAQEPEPSGRVVVAVLPYGVSVEQIGSVEGVSPGVVSAGLGSVPPAQSFLDISQGNRVNQSLYEERLPFPIYVRDGRLPAGLWDEITARAESAPANVTPGLLATTLRDAGVPISSFADDGLAPMIAVDANGEIERARGRECALGCPQGVTVVRAEMRTLRRIAAGLGPGDLLLAIAAGSRSEQQLWPAGIAGPGFDGNLTSDSTRTGGVVITSDIAPTILEFLGVEVPKRMNGSAIRTEGSADPAAVAELQGRLANRPSRATVALLPLGLWLLAAALVALLTSAGRTAFRVLGLACAWAPFLLLAAAALDASELQSGILMGGGAVVLALATERFAPGFRGLALACLITVGAHAVDVIAGSPYTALSVLGPNPGGGVRFFGIGNELEATLTTLALIGAGAWLASRRAEPSPRAAAAWFVGVAALATLAFAPGRFGADVGAAIVLGVGGATAAVLSLGVSRGRAAVLIVAGGAVALAALFAIDLALGGAHLSRSVLGAGEAGDIADVIDRRVSLMVRTFVHPVYPELLALTGIALVAGTVRRKVVLGWFGRAWAARNGFLGALAGVLIGTLANDSGSVLLVIGTIYLGAAVAFAWGNAPRTAGADAGVIRT